MTFNSDKKQGNLTPFVDLWPRLISAIILIIAALVTVIVGGKLFVLFWFVAAAAVSWEWQNLISQQRVHLRSALGAFGCALVAWLTWRHELAGVFILILAVAVIAACLAQQGSRLWAGGGIVYAALLVAGVCLLRLSPHHGLESIAFLFAIVWGADIFAYFGGRLIGGPKLWPAVSAGKTWSGSVIGLVCGAFCGLLALRLFSATPYESFPTLLLALSVAVISQFGDLFESAVKRTFGVKDSSQLIPGHGGVMDRLDAFIFAVIYASLLGLIHSPGSVAEGFFFW